ncbi:hypothetical protein C1924_19165 [Stenotrophomonas sp. ESTM1D_MKCIP4_1]|uniref:DUF4350 domain-containing protein n=1 Tax=Stenotrophomonas sp. ESTM1D_MKCIP4_1 TaxID=2072414 RepID=UPI000D53C8C1|nr:DUF4350 domain-containing protein [Stenotrophomonas sp. ESTM1D_MKCIP4_1]AWH55156.1 hypothetical protein C1924_19165 [Stenotrophomonas sp. ESTM1D_MKCIP4_1]
MSPRVFWSLLLGLLVLLGVPLAVLFLRTHEKVTETIVLPPRGEAAYNPLYVLGQALRADGIEVQSLQRLQLAKMALGDTDTVVLLQDTREMPPGTAQALLDWVGRGGHLLLRTQPPGEDKASTTQGPLLDRIGVESLFHGQHCQPFHVVDDPHHVEFCNGRRFSLGFTANSKAERRWGNEEGLAFARLRHGQGRIDVLADMEFMRGAGPTTPPRKRATATKDAPQRDGLHDLSHRDLTRYLLDPNYGRGTVWLVYGSRPPTLLARIVLQGWPVWIPLLLALLGWLWARAQRLGSVLPSPVVERRSLLEHVRASGELLLRFGHGAQLYNAVQALFLHRLRLRAPVAAALDGAARDQAIADVLQWPASRVATALTVPSPHDSSALRERIRLLLQMRSLL